MTDVRRIPQNGVAPFRQEKQEQVEVNWGQMTAQGVILFIGKFMTHKLWLNFVYFDENVKLD